MPDDSSLQSCGSNVKKKKKVSKRVRTWSCVTGKRFHWLTFLSITLSSPLRRGVVVIRGIQNWLNYSTQNFNRNSKNSFKNSN